MECFSELWLYETPLVAVQIKKRRKRLALAAMHIEAELTADRLFGKGRWVWVKDSTMATKHIAEFNDPKRVIEVR